MKFKFSQLRTLWAVLFAAFFLWAPLGAQAQWWSFGSNSNRPVISELLFNSVSALRVERQLYMSPEDLQQNKITVRGRTEVGQGKVGRVEASLDNGVTWTAVPFSEQGLFAFEFTPEIGRAYPFRIRSLSTTGQVSEEADNAFEFKLVKDDSRQLARETFEKLLQRYMARDRAGFMQLVSNRFAGDAVALDSALSNDFRFFDSIRIEPVIRQMAASNNRWIIHFNFTRQVRSTKTGQMLKDQAQSAVTLVRDGESYKLVELAAPLIFGVSDPSNVATYVAEGSAGRSVLTVDDAGNASTAKQLRSSTGAAGGSIRDARILQGQGITSSGSVVSYHIQNHPNGAIGLWDGNFHPGSDADGDIFILADSSLDAVQLPLQGSEQSSVAPQFGKLYGVKLSDGTTFVIKYVSGSTGPGAIPPGAITTANIQYRHFR
ncbi:hypothetical protein [Azonexus sp.]|uniref:hypothetical protein n=1 Tax=Azonexus sp. TaxID=1872668 RepID=UPI0039E31D30